MIMAMFSSKWVIAGLTLLSIVLLLLMIGRKSAHTEVIIKATPEKVWAVLTDFTQVKEWNSVLVPIQGELKEGNTIKYEFCQDEGGKAAVMDATVRKIIPGELINQTGGMPLVLTFNHKYILEPVGEGTKVTIHEEYRGVMVSF